MKRGTPGHKKMHRLAELLSVPLPMAVGIMEMLWHYASIHAPEGDIGSIPDAAISAAVYWPKKPAQLIDGLVGARWLDRDATYRLVTHDWPDHCEQAVKKWLDRNHKTFLPVYVQRLSSGYPPDGQMIDVVHPSREAEAEAKAQDVFGGSAEGGLPEQWLVNECGRKMLNPDWVGVRDALRAAQGKINNARNPQAYERAVIERHLAGRGDGGQ